MARYDGRIYLFIGIDIISIGNLELNTILNGFLRIDSRRVTIIRNKTLSFVIIKFRIQR